MKHILLVLALLVLGTLTIHAQTATTYAVKASPTAPFACSYTPSAPDCYGLGIVDNSTGAVGQIWVYSGWIQFMSGYEGLGMALVTSNNGLGTITFEDEATGGKAYTGTMDFTYQTYLCGRWHNQHCWEITGGTVTITRH